MGLVNRSRQRANTTAAQHLDVDLSYRGKHPSGAMMIVFVQMLDRTVHMRTPCPCGVAQGLEREQG